MRQGSKYVPLIVAFVTMLIIGTDLFVVSPLLKPISIYFDVSVGMAGISVTSFSLAYVIGAPIFGKLGDIFNKKIVLVIGLIGFAAANIFTAISSSYTIFIVARAFAGITAAAISPSVYALVGKTAPSSKKASWMSIAVAGFLISLTTGAPTGVYISQISSWNAVFIFIATLSLFMAILNWFAWPKSDNERITKKDLSSITTKIKAVSITGTWGFSVYATYTYLAAGLQSKGNFNSEMIAIALIVYGIGAVIGSLSGGRLADRMGANKVAMASLIGLSLMEIIISFLLKYYPNLQLLILLSLTIFSIVAYPCLPSYQGKLVEKFPKESGSIMAWNSSIMYFGTSLGAAFGGFVFSRIGFLFVPLLGAVVSFMGGYLCYLWRK